jgi:hypothetical protein
VDDLIQSFYLLPQHQDFAVGLVSPPIGVFSLFPFCLEQGLQLLVLCDNKGAPLFEVFGIVYPFPEASIETLDLLAQ